MRRAESPPAPVVVRLGAVESTQTAAFDLAARGAADRTVVLADHQTAGRGRLGRTWEDGPRASLLASIIVRPRLATRSLPWLSYVAAVAVLEALETVAGVAPRLKWPNDVLVAGRKIAGILLETRMSGSIGPHAAPPVTVIGIGINLEPASVPPALADRATCVRDAGGRAVERETVLAAVLDAFDLWRERLEHEGFEPIRRRWLMLAETIGRQVEAGGTRGIAVDLDADGALVVEGGGVRHRVVAGELGA